MGDEKGLPFDLISIFPGAPEIKSGFINIAEFKNDAVSAMKETEIIIIYFKRIVFIISFWYLESISCAIGNLVVKSGSIAGIKRLAVYAGEITHIIAKTRADRETSHIIRNV